MGGVALRTLAVPGVGEVLAALGEAGRIDVVAPLADRPASCPDVRALARVAAGEGRPLVVDATLPTLPGCPAVRQGAALALDAAASGVVLALVGRTCPSALREVLSELPPWEGNVANLLEARGAEHRRRSDAAQEFACYLECHPAVACVRYPGLRHDPSFVVAAQVLQGGFGPVVDWLPAGAAASGVPSPHDDGATGWAAPREAREGTSAPPWRRVDVGSSSPRELIRAFEASAMRPIG